MPQKFNGVKIHHTYIHTCLLLLILMLWHRQANACFVYQQRTEESDGSMLQLHFDKCRQLFIKTVVYLPRYPRIKSEPVSVVIQSCSQSSSSVCFPPFGRTFLLQILANPYRSRTGSIRACCCRCHTGKHIQIPYRIYKGMVLRI